MRTQKLILIEQLRSLSEILFRPSVGGLSQEGREDSDYGDKMELDETTVSDHESRENDQGVFRGTFTFGCNDRTRRDVTISQIMLFD
jgi:WD and tetratricopeptide repeats protein 1